MEPTGKNPRRALPQHLESPSRSEGGRKPRMDLRSPLCWDREQGNPFRIRWCDPSFGKELGKRTLFRRTPNPPGLRFLPLKADMLIEPLSQARSFRPPLLTVRDLVGLSPLLIDEDDRHQDQHLGHDAQERPQGCQAAANPQAHHRAPFAQLVGAVAHVLARVLLEVQGDDPQVRPVAFRLDEEPLLGAVDDGLGGRKERKPSDLCASVKKRECSCLFVCVFVSLLKSSSNFAPVGKPNHLPPDHLRSQVPGTLRINW